MHDENRIILIKPDGKTKRVISKPSQISKFGGVLWSKDSSRLYIIDGSNQDLYYNFKVYAINIYSETCILLAKYKFRFSCRI